MSKQNCYCCIFTFGRLPGKLKVVTASDENRSTTRTLVTPSSPSTSATLERFHLVADAMITSGITE